MMQQNTVYKKSSLNKNNRLKVKYQKNMHDSNIEQKEVGIATLIVDKVDFRMNNITRKKDTI